VPSHCLSSFWIWWGFFVVVLFCFVFGAKRWFIKAWGQDLWQKELLPGFGVLV